MDDWYSIPAEHREALLAKGCIKAAYESAKNMHEMFNWGEIKESCAHTFADVCDSIYLDFPMTWEEYAKTLPGKRERIETFKEKYHFDYSH